MSLIVIKRKETTFGSYILGQTLGEGEFGKVKLGWKRDGHNVGVRQLT
jgi:protein-serine/threonine kinase